MGPTSKGLHLRMQYLQLSFVCIIIVIFLRISSHSVFAVVSPSLRQSIESNAQKVNNLLRSNNSSNSTNSNINQTNIKASNSSGKVMRIPLENIFPSSINSNIQNTSDDSGADAGEILRKALINHTLTHGGEDDLDELIFSSLPEGKKLVLQSVRVIPTDEHGHPIDDYETEAPVNWNVKFTNATDIPDDEEEDEGSEHEEEKESRSEGKSDISDPNKLVQNDLAISGSHSQANYKAYGDNHRNKEKTKKHYHGNDYGKTHKVTDTDTDGVKVKKYHGTEDGLTDFANSHGKAQSNEGERYKDSKKKHKGRRVSGFKRVYHKEEFQRTEHFYDDEDAKRIAESYGLKDAKENSNHGTKGNDRKYHGIRNEYLDGNKVKNEHGTSHGFNKGQHTEYKDSEKHNHASHYDKSQHLPHKNNNHYQNNNRQQHHYHPNHNYYAAYSHPKNMVRRPTVNNAASNNEGIVAIVAKAPMTASYVVTEYSHALDAAGSSSTDVPTLSAPKPPMKKSKRIKGVSMTLERPDEIKTFYSPREHSHEAVQATSPTSNNIRQHHAREQRHQQMYLVPKHRNTFIKSGHPRPTPFHRKVGNASLIDDDSFRKNYTSYYRNGTGTYHDGERYARNFPTSTVRNTLLGPVPGGYSYSTIVKVMPVKYINLTDEESQLLNHAQNDSRQQSVNLHQIAASPSGYRSSNSQQMNIKDITFTTMRPISNRRPQPPKSKWISITIGDPDGISDSDNHNSNHNYNGYMAIRPLTNLVRGVKNKLMQPILRPRYVTSAASHSQVGDNRFDPSKYPPNVVKVKNTNTVGSYSSASHQSTPQGTNGFISTVQNTQQNRKPHVYIQSSPNSQNNGHLNGYPVTSYQNNNNGYSYSNPAGTRPRLPHQLPPFMNNLMDSVANFFSNVG